VTAPVCKSRTNTSAIAPFVSLAVRLLAVLTKTRYLPSALIEGRWKGVIHRSDLDNKNAFNTYQHTGLPPGPIANPGVASIRAALHPAETANLYFVAKPGGGGHVFSAGLAAHARAVQDYRRGKSGQGKAKNGINGSIKGR